MLGNSNKYAELHRIQSFLLKKNVKLKQVDKNYIKKIIYMYVCTYITLNITKIIF